MAIRRGRVPVYGTSNYAGVSTKASRQRGWSTMPARSSYSTIYAPGISKADSAMYDTRVEDYLLSSRVDDVGYLSRSTLDEGYDTVQRSRGRDQQLLRDATNAIVSSESYATPQTSVVSRRVARGRSVAQRAASVPPRPAPKVYPEPKLTERKAIRTEEGYTKPKNIMSWQYRLDSMMSPNDLLYQPSSFIRIREQVRDAQDRMDRHRQLIDRYLPEGEGGDVAANVLRKMHEMEKRNPVSYRSGAGDEMRRSTRQ